MLRLSWFFSGKSFWFINIDKYFMNLKRESGKKARLLLLYAILLLLYLLDRFLSCMVEIGCINYFSSNCTRAFEED